MKKENKSVGLEMEDAMNRVRWRVGVGEIAVRVINPNQNWIDDDDDDDDDDVFRDR